VLRDDSLALATRLQEAVSFSDVAQRALARSGAWLKGR